MRRYEMKYKVKYRASIESWYTTQGTIHTSNITPNWKSSDWANHVPSTQEPFLKRIYYKNRYRR